MRFLRLILTASVLFWAALAHGEDTDPISKLAWQIGPAKTSIGDKGEIDIPKGYAFLNAAETAKFMELNQNLSHGNEYLVAPTSLDWFALFSFNPVGYVKDDETVDADAVLESVKKGTEAGNEERKRRGWPTMSIVGWRFQPQYDRQTKLLEWAFLGKDDRSNGEVVNYNTRLLGRSGVMEVVLVADPTAFDTSVASLKTLLTGYEFAPGEKYAEFKQGDRVAEFGLAALVAGGAAAVAAKKGFFAVIGGFLAAAWKFVVAAIIGVGAWLKSLLGKRKE